MSPPIPASVDDSTRNWLRMSPRRAPTALRMPISWVRSVTTASMMFMITTPPTTRNTETTADGGRGDRSGHPLPGLLQRFGRDHAEGVLLVRPQMTGGAEQRPDLVLRGVQLD